MEVLAMLKFWKSSTTAKVAAGTAAFYGNDDETVSDSAFSDPLMSEDDDFDDDESFFELELALPESDTKTSQSDSKFTKSEQEREYESKLSSKPQSPISILRSAAPKLQVFMFGKLRRKFKDDDFESESVSSNLESPRKSNSSNSNLFTVKFKIEDGSIVPKFARTNSSKLFHPKRNSDEFSDSSKRFSKDVQKYLNLIKLPYGKSSKTEKFPASPARSKAASSSSVQSPRKEREEKQSSRFKVKCKNLGKSKSDSAMVVSSSPVSFPAKNDHSHDGAIEGAILHCKRSLTTSSTGQSSLSRCSSEPSS